MKKTLFIIGLIAAILSALPAYARPQKGFHTGPYLCLEVGMSHNDFDYNERLGQKVGTNIEPAVGFLFGWNVFDWLSAELAARYSTSEKDDRREHIAGANLNTKFFLITDALTDFDTLRILPFAKTGLAIHASVLPGDPASTDSHVTSFAYGPSVGAGVMFLFQKYVYLGLNAQGDFLFFDDISQDVTVNGVTSNQMIYKGGITPQYVISAILGVHF